MAERESDCKRVFVCVYYVFDITCSVFNACCNLLPIWVVNSGLVLKRGREGEREELVWSGGEGESW